MAVSRRSARLPAIKRSAALDEYSGEWVALVDGHVVAHSPSSREVVRQMKALGPTAEGAVLMRAASSADAVAVGLG